MNLDDYEKIPCSAKEYLQSDDTMSVQVGKESFWFKLVPKKKSVGFYCYNCGTITKQDARPDRFAEIDCRVDVILSDCTPFYRQGARIKELIRAIVELIEKEKV